MVVYSKLAEVGISTIILLSSPATIIDFTNLVILFESNVPYLYKIVRDKTCYCFWLINNLVTKTELVESSFKL